MSTNEPSIIDEIQNGMSVYSPAEIKKADKGWLIADRLVWRDGPYWLCHCPANVILGLCEHTVAVAASVEPETKAVGEAFMTAWKSLGSQTANMKMALNWRPR
jgi:hypothetical protein